MKRDLKTYGQWRKTCYASVNATKENLIKFSKSDLLKPLEKEKLKEVIAKIEELRVLMKQDWDNYINSKN